MANQRSESIFYGWRIVAAAFLNLFFVVGIIFYGFPVFYPALVESLGFTRAQVTQGFLVGFMLVGLPFGFLAGALIDRIGVRRVILSGAGFVGASLVLMGWINNFRQYEMLCITEVFGYVLAGPIANQVLIAQRFRAMRGRAMGYAYLGLGFGGVVAPALVHFLIRSYGWRHAIEIVGTLTILVLFPVNLWIMRSGPSECGRLPASSSHADTLGKPNDSFTGVGAAVRTANFWYILLGSTLVIGAIGAVIQHFIFFLKDLGYSTAMASRFSTVLLASSLIGRVVVGYVADRFKKKNVMALFYLLIGGAILSLGVWHEATALWMFAFVFGFSMGADYMLIPLVTAECFGTASLGKILALIIMGYSVGQWGAPWLMGRIFDVQHSYDLGWKIMAAAGLAGAAVAYSVSVRFGHGG